MIQKIPGQIRNSEMEYGKIYFWTATVNKWMRLLKSDNYKEIIISCLSNLSDRKKIDVFAFVLMPTHLHLIWRLLEPNGKESPKASFLKFTAHEFKKQLCSNPFALEKYRVNASNKNYEFWKRDPLAIWLYTEEVMQQKLEYIHNNPLSAHWNLATDPCKYKYSSAGYYLEGRQDFSFLKDIREEF